MPNVLADAREVGLGKGGEDRDRGHVGVDVGVDLGDLRSGDRQGVSPAVSSARPYEHPGNLRLDFIGRI